MQYVQKLLHPCIIFTKDLYLNFLFEGKLSYYIRRRYLFRSHRIYNHPLGIFHTLAAALPARRIPGLTIVQLNGASDPMQEGPSAGQMLSRMGAALGARTIGFPVPAFFDQAATRRAMWSERSIKRILVFMSHLRRPPRKD